MALEAKLFHQTDPIARICYLMATKPMRRRGGEAYGAVALLTNHTIVGLGRSCRGENVFGLTQGSIMHAEASAALEAMKFGHSPENLVIAVAGGNLQTGNVFINPPDVPFSCLSCAKYLRARGVNGLLVSRPEGWKFVPARAALASAKQFEETKTGTDKTRGETRATITDGRFPLLLPKPDEVTEELINEIIDNVIDQGYQIAPHIETILRLWPDLVSLPPTVTTLFLSGLSPETCSLKIQRINKRRRVTAFRTPVGWMSSGEFRAGRPIEPVTRTSYRKQFLNSPNVSPELRQKVVLAWSRHDQGN